MNIERIARRMVKKMNESDISETEIKRRNWLNEMNALTDKICELSMRVGSLGYSIDLLNIHRSQVKREIVELKSRQELLQSEVDL